MVNHGLCFPALPPQAEHATDDGIGACPRHRPLDVTEATGNEYNEAMKRYGEVEAGPVVGSERTATRSRPPNRQGAYRRRKPRRMHSTTA